jgi:hypothetical protein
MTAVVGGPTLVVSVVSSTTPMWLMSLILTFMTRQSVAAQDRQLMPIDHTAAVLINSLSLRRDGVDFIQQHFVAAPLPVRDGVETIFVQGMGEICGAANCQAYILERQHATYRLLLNAHAIQQIHILNSVTNGYHDIQTDMHGSATSSDLRIYRFDGKQYRLNQCLSRDYQLDDQGGVSAKPVITRHACGR